MLSSLSLYPTETNRQMQQAFLKQGYPPKKMKSNPTKLQFQTLNIHKE